MACQYQNFLQGGWWPAFYWTNRVHLPALDETTLLREKLQMARDRLHKILSEHRIGCDCYQCDDIRDVLKETA